MEGGYQADDEGRFYRSDGKAGRGIFDSEASTASQLAQIVLSQFLPEGGAVNSEALSGQCAVAIAIQQY